MNPPAWPKLMKLNQTQTLRRGEGPLKSRKQLLIAESELNRAQLVQELEVIADKVHTFADQSRTVASLATAAATLIAGLASLRRKKEPDPTAEKPSWLQTIVKGAGLVSTLWSTFRSSRREKGE